MTAIGAVVPHESAADHVTGAALYTDDLVGRFPGVLHAWPVLAPHAHALIGRLDTAPALAEAGVVVVLTADSVPGQNDTGAVRHDEPLFPREVMFHRQPVAWVVAETIDSARRGAERVEVDYEPLPAILTIEQAITANSYLTETLRISNGDLSGMPSSALRVEGEIAIGGQEHFYLETHSAIAWLDETGGVAVHSSTQHPTQTQEVVARVLGLSRHRVTVECVRMGGAFGGKEVQANAFAAVAALGAWTTRRPVRVRVSRDVDIAITGKRHPYLARYAAGFSVDGHLQALRVALYSDGGWCLDLSEAVMWRSLFHCDNAYRLPAVEVVGRVCRTHKTSQTAFRGFGGPQAMLVIEEVLGQAAQRLSIPAHDIRERNFYQEGDSTHYGQVVDQASRLPQLWRRLMTTSDFARRRHETGEFNRRHEHVKRGLAITPVKFGIAFTASLFNQAGALVLVFRDGSVQVNQGGTEMGQGLSTKIQQIAADQLGVLSADVRVMSVRTDKVPNTSATAASSGTDLNGAAVADACAQVHTRLAGVAAELLACDPSGVHFEGRIVRGGERRMAFSDLCEAAYQRRVPLFAHGFYRTPGIHFDAQAGRGRPFQYFSVGAAVSEVEVDGFTGQHRLLRTDILHDVGDSISPIIDRGQIEGAFLQGVGWLTLEELLWDAQGRITTNSASTYKLPSLSEVPEVFVVDFLEKATQAGSIAGSKAVGEPPLMLAISVREAIREAVSAFGDEGDVVTFDSPATPERVFFAVSRVRSVPISASHQR